MVDMMNLKEFERKAFRSTFQDGLWDILIGVIALNFAMGTWLGNQGWGDFWGPMTVLPINLLVYAGVWLGKKYITLPRVGRVKFSPARNRKTRKLVAAISILLALCVLAGLVILSVNSNLPGSVLPAIIFAILCLAVFGLAATWLNVPRFWAYGALLAITYPIGHLMKQGTVWGVRSAFAPFFVTGPLIIIVGVALLLRFVRDYPVSIPEDANGII